jgi:uncharacterized membrane protein
MMRLWFLIVLGLFIGGIVHVLSLLMVPALAPNDAYSRLESVLPVNEFKPLPPADSHATPFFDPAFDYRLCRYDLMDGPVRIVVPVNESYLSLAFHARDSVVYFALNDRSSVGGMLDLLLYDASSPQPEAAIMPGAPTILVPAPTPNGLVVIRALVASRSQHLSVQSLLEKARCVPLVGAGQ